MKWINIIGLCLQFFAFWLAAPELLGADTMKRFETGLVKFISNLPSLLLGLMGFSFGIAMGYYGVKSGMEASDGNGENIGQTMIIIGITSVLYIIYMVFFYKRLQKWMERILAKPLVQKLIANNESRKAALVVGASLFTLGFILQLTALLFS